MADFIGIDLGTTFSLISCFREDGSLEVLYLDTEERLLPSVVHFDKSSGSLEIHVGIDAKKAAEYDNVNVVSQIKKSMGEDSNRGTPNSGPLTPTEISSEILKKLIKTGEDILESEIDTATITVPANWFDNQKIATENAGNICGLQNVHIINEPTSAALFYGVKRKENGKVLVYDLGGGTFDITILNIVDQDIEVITNRGSQMGGSDFDWKLFEILNEKHLSEKGANILSEYETIKESDLKIVPISIQADIEQAKHSLSKKNVVKVTINNAQSGPFRCEITRQEFEASISEYVAKSEILIDAALEESNLSKDDIDHILLVGGSTRLPCFENSVRNFFSKEPRKVANVDEVVSLGAALNTALKSDIPLTKSQSEILGEVSFQDVVNHHFGTISVLREEDIRALLGSENHKGAVGINDVLLKKNTPIPCEHSSKYKVSKGMVEAGIWICQLTQSHIETVNPTEVNIVRTETREISDLEEGDPVTVTYKMNQNQVLECEFKNDRTGKTIRFESTADDINKGLKNVEEE